MHAGLGDWRMGWWGPTECCNIIVIVVIAPSQRILNLEE